MNGSPNEAGNTYTALNEMVKVFQEEGIETEIVQVGKQNIRGCIACNTCKTTGKCVFNDLVNVVAEKFKECDGLVVGSPVYYASANPTVVAFMSRLFYSVPCDKTMKVGASVVAARRSGTTATYDELNKFFGIAGMPIASGQYWNNVHGLRPGEAVEDGEGLQSMRTLARNMSFLIKSIDLGKKEIGLPKKEKPIKTNFIK